MNEKQIGELVEAFYVKIRRDQMLGPIFDVAIGDQWDAHLATMRTFWSTILFGSASYKGDPLEVHMRLPELNPLHFERWLALWRETAQEICGDDSTLFIQRAEAIARRLAFSVSPVTTSLRVMPGLS